jgi:hypothetical protein
MRQTVFFRDAEECAELTLANGLKATLCRLGNSRLKKVINAYAGKNQFRISILHPVTPELLLNYHVIEVQIENESVNLIISVHVPLFKLMRALQNNLPELFSLIFGIVYDDEFYLWTDPFESVIEWAIIKKIPPSIALLLFSSAKET